jgi:hypothetical protein
LACAVLAAACGLSVTGPFEGFDGEGSRLSGSFRTDLAAQSGGGAGPGDFSGLRVSVRERPSLSTTVAADGAFGLVGVPSGAWSLLFQRDQRLLGELRFNSVRTNQGIRIEVALTANDEVVLLSESRDSVSFGEDECPRGPGFWCQNQDGNNPNLTAEEFRQFAAEAATLLSSVPALDSADEIARAVCDTGDQLLRQLATLALNLAADTITRDTALAGEPFATVGAAFDRAVELARDPAAGRDERNRVKDVLDRINNNQNHEACEDGGDDDDPDDPPTPPPSPPPSGKVTICHIPPGNPAARHTITIDSSAWPAHLAHGDTLGPCS